MGGPVGGASPGEAGLTDPLFPAPSQPPLLIGRLEHTGGEKPIRAKCLPLGAVPAAPIGRIKGKLRQRGTSCPPRAPAVVRRLQPLPHRTRGPDPAPSPGRAGSGPGLGQEPQLPGSCPPPPPPKNRARAPRPGGPVGRPTAGSPWGRSCALGTESVPTLVPPAPPAPSAGGQHTGSAAC